MKWIIHVTVSIFILSGCALKNKEQHPSGIVVKEIRPDKFTAMTKQNLLHLAQIYELSPFLYTKAVHIQSGSETHSRQVLTINAKFAEYPNKILSTFLHEELHWWARGHEKNIALAAKDLEKSYPNAPVAKDSTIQKTYQHLIICHLELKALAFYIGEREARGVISSLMRKDQINPWVYRQVLYKDASIKRAIRNHKLRPPILYLESNKKSAALF